MGARRAIIGAALLLAALAGTASGQVGYFGQNKIQYRDFEWRVLHGAHVDLYFYPDEDELARLALTYAEESFRFLERKFGHSPARRIPLIIYASHTDFEQTNILPFVPPEGLLGVTEFLKRRVALPFNGSYEEFRHTLRHELVHVFQLSVQSATSRLHPRTGRPDLPLWWTEGLAELWSAGEDSRDEMVLRDLTISGTLPRLPQLAFAMGSLVYPLGGAIHRWLAEEFGDWRVQLFYHDLWRYRSFTEAIAGVYGTSLVDLDNRFRDHLQQKHFPRIVGRRPLNVSANGIAKLAVKPYAYRATGDSTTRVLFISPGNGYMSIYGQRWKGPGRPWVVVQGERSAEFESFHPFDSRLDVRGEIAIFASKYLERDALFFWDLARNRVVGRYQFPRLVSILSPTWAPDGKSVVFSGLTISGYSDLYRLWLDDGRLEQLTSDRYQDVDPAVSPDGETVVFSSDRTPRGAEGAHNLFALDLETHATRYVTYGPWRDESPRWGEDGRIYFSSDREGVFDIYSVTLDGNGRRETRAQTGAFDPQWVPEENALLFTGFSDLSFEVFRAAPHDSATRETFALATGLPEHGWSWPELTESPYARTDPTPYERKFTLDFAAGDAAFAPGVGAAQGAVFLFSDLLGDHLLFASLTSFQGNGLGGLVDNLNGSIFYLNQKRRLNWGAGVFRVRGLFYEDDFRTVYDETAFGAFADVRWPYSRFSRVEGQLRLERSDRFDVVGGNIDEPHRVGWLASNYLSFVHDNSLWLPTGPIDGARSNLTAGVSNDVSNGRFDSWTVSLDHRRYFRIAMHSAYSIRLFGYVSGGSRPRRLTIGGPWGVRGYPRIGQVSGTEAVLFNQEIRFPIIDFLSLGFPFGEARFPGVQGAAFFDLGGARFEGSARRGILGSAGLGLRMPLGPVVLRLDLGYRFDVGDSEGYGLAPASRRRRFADFFFGFNY